MICFHCGRELPDGSKFCDGCGNAQMPAAEPKKSKKGLVIGICAALVILVAAAAVFLLIPRTETVYVLETHTNITPEGKETEYTYRFDENGNPTRLYNFMGQCIEMEFDDYGNPTEVIRYNTSDAGRQFGFTYEYKYSYDDHGRIETCKEYANDTKKATWNFTWDKKGNLTQVMLDEVPKFPGLRIARQDWEYDKEGRLIKEYVCGILYGSGPENVSYAVYCCEYFYDDDGNLERYEYGMSRDPVEDYEDLDYDVLDFGKNVYYAFSYNSYGKIATVETNYRNGTASEREYDYDRDGNLEVDDDYAYDDQGNLLWEESDNGYRNEWEYETEEMSHEAAARYRRWVSLYGIDSVKTYYHPLMSFAGQSDMFYYYLIPNPIW